MIYFDNAATSRYMPYEVMNAYVKECSRKSNAGRGGHSESVRAGLIVYKARERINRFFGNEKGECIFTKNCTEALNLALLGIKLRGHILTTATEHNSVLRPLSALKERGVEVSYVTPDREGRVTLERIKPYIRSDTYMIALNARSNVTGEKSEYERIFAYATEKGIITLLDGAQEAGHGRINMNHSNVDLLALAGHKGLYGVQGIGCLLFRRGLKISPILYGGTGSLSVEIVQPEDYPEGLEAGTQNVAGIAALKAAVDWTDERLEEIAENNLRLTASLIDGLRSIDGLRIYSSSNAAGIVSFIKEGFDSERIADHLNEYGVAVRGGLHCAPLIHRHLGTLSTGLVRVSFGYGNTLKEVKYTLNTLNELEN
ncbi:MAG: aminotransferase class V-fold PLP-dependent enzyme [Clostridia bacterium]|nr:aminotransferase class V-fold PLP-dependent enzyme [Clostridia bacterium]